MRRTARWILVSVLVMDGLFAVLYLSGALTPTFAQTAPASNAGPRPAAPEPGKAADPAQEGDRTEPMSPGLAARFADNPWSQQTLEALGREMAARAEALERREADVAEIERSSLVLERAGIEESDSDAETGSQAAPEADGQAPGAGDPSAAQPVIAPPDPAEVAASHAAFLRLQKAYENMEPESAAQALAGLAEKDRQAVVRLLLGWSPRVSGAILDALTQTKPELAAELSYDIWKLSGGK